MKYLITGIRGFAGPHLANKIIEDGHEVVALLRAVTGQESDILDVVPEKNFSKIKFVFGDLSRYETLANIFKKNEIDGAFHLAAQSHPPTSFLDPIGTFDTNTIGTMNLAQAIKDNSPNTKLMFCSTSEVYGAPLEEKGPITEDFPISPINPYGVSKAAADLYIRNIAKAENLPFFVTRAFSHTGPRRGRIFSISDRAFEIVTIEKGMKKPLVRHGKLDAKRAIIDVRDCVNAYYLLMNKFKPGEAYNIGGDQVYTMGSILDKLLSFSKIEGEVTKEPAYDDPATYRPIDIPVQICDSTKARNLTGWKPKIQIDQTLNDLLNYWRMKIN
ncbi:MAG TPA: GDP-mannose 4,6-dehydratase [Candidatus Nanoarchaeia archaeon]|nr:GDP-mannose 4,6-dehydratase [Candidatus Nanoarchaeia archaeon]